MAIIAPFTLDGVSKRAPAYYVYCCLCPAIHSVRLGFYCKDSLAMQVR